MYKQYKDKRKSKWRPNNHLLSDIRMLRRVYDTPKETKTKETKKRKMDSEPTTVSLIEEEEKEKDQKTKDFIAKAIAKHGDLYNYSDTKYQRNREHVTIICNLHGIFMQTPKAHKAGDTCPECRKDVRRNTDTLTAKFIIMAQEVHGDTYDYSETMYQFAREKVVIICRVHGKFEQTPNGHLSKKAGCTKCATERNAEKTRHTTEDFISAATLVHGGIYCYSKSNYISAMANIVIICKIHGEFEQTPNSHISKKSGCSKCSGVHQPTTMEFIEKAMSKHGDLFDYSKTEYCDARTDIIIICKIHGEFLQTPNSHLSGAGCFKCAHGMVIFSTEDFINAAQKTHGKTFTYDKSCYVTMTTKIIITCSLHGDFEQTPSNHITHSQGCPICGGRALSNTEDFIAKAIAKHGDKYGYLHVNYVNNTTFVLITCKVHGLFEQTPANHLWGSNCRKCKLKYSKGQILWLNFMSELNGIDIEHAENGGEFRIPGTRFAADGYCKETNTIYEYHGDFWHGNPKTFNPSHMNPISKKTFGELHRATMEREQQLAELGYTIVVTYESDWNKLNRCVQFLQRKYRT